MGKCDICDREQKNVGSGREYKHGMQFIMEMEDMCIPPRIRKQTILCWDLCNECELSIEEQAGELYEEIYNILKNEKDK